MKISPYTSYLELQPNVLLVRQKFYYLQKVGIIESNWSLPEEVHTMTYSHITSPDNKIFRNNITM
jgi:hypothetical protein